MSQVREIAEKLGAAKKTQAGYICRCPCHDDKKGDSLSIKESVNGNIIFHCFANCDYKDIAAYCVAHNIMPFRKIQHKTEKTTSRNSYFEMKILRTHEYLDEKGNYLFEKVKTEKPNKQGNNQFLRTRQTNGDYIWNASHIKIKPLYNLPNVIRGVRDAQTIYVTEGEKDADTLNKFGLVATTSCTSSSWTPEYSSILKGAHVIVLPDNDAPGMGFAKKRINSIKKEASLCKMVLLPETYNDKKVKDVTDFFEAGATITDFNKLISDTEEITSKTKNKDEASRKDYIKLINEFYGETKRDIFSDDLCYFDKFSKLWVPAANKIKPLKSEIREKSLSSTKEIRHTDVEDHLYYLESIAEPQFMVYVPEWDGVDRIKILAERVKLDESRLDDGINNQCFEDLLKFWHAKMWMRLNNPEIRNEIFILAGPQNIGKDFWIRENCGALGQYLVNFSIHTNERDTKEQLHRGLVMNVSEFDRTSRAEVSLLKEVVTATQTDLRFAYDRRAMTRLCRCSFIASTNVRDIFNDPTGHSRYVFFELKDIEIFQYNSKAYNHLKSYKNEELDIFMELADNYFFNINPNKGIRDFLLNDLINLNTLPSSGGDDENVFNPYGGVTDYGDYGSPTSGIGGPGTSYTQNPDGTVTVNPDTGGGYDTGGGSSVDAGGLSGVFKTLVGDGQEGLGLL